MKKIAIALTATCIILPELANAEANDWVIRTRMALIAPNESSDLGQTVNKQLGATVMSPGADLSVDNNVIPEVDISYYFTKNIAAELILALGSRHKVNIVGDSLGTVTNQSLGSVNVLPPTLTAQWHFNPDQMIDPYVGLGLNYSFMLDKNAKFSQGALAGTKIKVDRDSVGAAFQAGVDINLKDNWLVNFDLKYIKMDLDVKTKLDGVNWATVDHLEVNPWVIGLGIGKKF